MEHQIDSEEELRAITGGPVHDIVVVKSIPTLTEPLKRYIGLSPFVCIGTHDDDGLSDVSPRGDGPGFCQILDEKTIVIPDRPGNNRLDSIINIIKQPKLSLLFMIPGVLETVRVNGTGVISNDPALLKQFEVKGKLPALVIVVTVNETFAHCSKAFRRSKLWDTDYIPTGSVPSLAEMMGNHLQLDNETSEVLEKAIEDDAKNRMY